MRQSLRIIRQAIDNLPDGPYHAEDRKDSRRRRAELDVSMEALIHHFKLMTEGFQVPPGMYYHGIEVEQGRTGLLRLQRRLGKPYRPRAGPSFNNLCAVSKMSQGRHALGHRDLHRLD